MPSRLNADWAAIQLAYLGGETTRSLAEKHGIKESTIRSKASRQKWRHPPRVAASTEVGALALQAAHNVWAQRKDQVKESEFTIAERIMEHAASMPEDQLVNKADKIKIGVDMGRRSVGLDQEDKNKNAVNIAILGEVDERSLAAMTYAEPAPSKELSSQPEQPQAKIADRQEHPEPCSGEPLVRPPQPHLVAR